MPRSPDGTTDTYLDVLRTLGVTDAALRRHHDADAETPLRVAIDGDRGAPTADLLSALGATGRVLDLRHGLAVDDGDRLTASLGRFGYAVECSAADTADGSADGADLTLRVRDVVTDDIERIHTAGDAAAVETTLRDELLADLEVELVELLDGRHLVAEARELDALASSYGGRIQPFDDPLLVPDAAVETDGEPSDGAAVAASDSATPDATATTAKSGTGAPESGSRSSSRSPTEATADGDSFGDVIADADDATTDSIEAALSRDGPSTHTIEEDDDLATASETTVGGGPRRTVSTTGIDEVFDQLESSTAASDAARIEADTVSAENDAVSPESDAVSADSSTTMSESSSDPADPPSDASTSTDDPIRTENGLTGGPTRTVSTTSADDIIARATGERDFEEIAAEEGDADPDAVLAEGEVPPALEDSGVTPALSAGSTEDATDVDASSADESTADAAVAPAESGDAVGSADRPPADPAAPGPADEPIPSPAPDPDADAVAGDDATADEILATPGVDGGTDATQTGGSTTAADDESADGAESNADGEPTPSAESPSDAEPTRGEPSGDEPTDDVARAADPGATDDDPATPMPPAGDEGAGSEQSTEQPAEAREGQQRDGDGTPDPGDLGEELLGDDVELRRGTESVDEPPASVEASDATGGRSGDRSAADGPLAAAGGVRPDEDTGQSASDRAGTPADRPTAADHPTDADRSTVEEPSPGDATGSDARGSDGSSTEGTPPSATPADTSSGDAGPADESSDDGDDAGLVGRITSTIFGR